MLLFNKLLIKSLNSSISSGYNIKMSELKSKKTVLVYAAKHPHSIVISAGTDQQIYTTKHRVYYIYCRLDTQSILESMIIDAEEYFKKYFGDDFDHERIKIVELPMLIKDYQEDLDKLNDIEKAIEFIKEKVSFSTTELTIDELIAHPYYNIYQVQKNSKPDFDKTINDPPSIMLNSCYMSTRSNSGI